MSIPKGLYGRISSRNDIAHKQNIDVAAGVIDPDYHGEIKVLLVNNSQKRHVIRKGDVIAQIIFEQAATPAMKLLSGRYPTKRNINEHTNNDRPYARTVPHVIPNDDIASPSLNTPSTPIDTPAIVEDEPPRDNSEESSKNLPPIIRPVDKPRSSAPKTVTITEDNLRKYVGFQNTTRMIPHLTECFKSNFHFSTLDREPILDIGEVTTIDKSRISTKTVTLPPTFGDALHMDIGYGCNAGLNGIK